MGSTHWTVVMDRLSVLCAIVLLCGGGSHQVSINKRTPLPGLWATPLGSSLDSLDRDITRLKRSPQEETSSEEGSGSSEEGSGSSSEEDQIQARLKRSPQEEDSSEEGSGSSSEEDQIQARFKRSPQEEDSSEEGSGSSSEEDQIQARV